MTDTNPPRLYLDTNVFIAAFEVRAEPILQLFFRNPKSDRPHLFTSLLTRAELLVKPYRDGDDRLISLYESWTLSNEILRVGEIDGEVLRFAAVLRAQYPALKLPDAVHLSTAIGFDCTHFVSSDKRFGKVPTITHKSFGISKVKWSPAYVDPSGAEWAALVEQVLT